ncbi:zinc finger B-box domain-containing protein 1 [Macrotis lagotis]|uniref:zinc finger B-box domain-containing protein 1 n=1 Tax=Macrotis lagotis TaxID=92651 RepID=UPI003D6997B0
MNSNDFIVLPWGKAGNSVKLKAKNVRELQVEKVQLELETQEMEKKLQQLQSSMSREKEERERSSGFHWKSGQLGKLGNQSQVMSPNKENVVKISPGKVKLKILKDQMQAVIKQPISYKVTTPSASEKAKGKGKLCGQCENKYALLVCLECGEDYCSGCFARIHQKGALKRHRTTLLETRAQVLSRLDIAHKFLKEIYPDERQEKQNLKKEISKNENASKTQFLQISDSKVDVTSLKNPESTNQTGGLLLQGSFDEEESARSFQEILTQWRNGNHENKGGHTQRKAQTSPEQMEVSEVQTNLKIWGEPLQIEFKDDSLTYVERLWLKKHRRYLPNLYNINTQHKRSGNQAVQWVQDKLFLENLQNSFFLQKIALRSKPITQQYKGLERFFVSGKNPLQEKLRLNLAKRSEVSPSNNRITLTGNEQWVSESSLSEHADDSVVEDVVWNNQKKVSGVQYPQRGQISRRPSSVNIPICKKILNRYKTSVSLHQRPRSMNSRPISRAASEISEIEYLDATEQNEPFFEDAADHQTLNSLERELNALKNFSDAPERLYNLNSEKLSEINRHSKKTNEIMTDVLKIPGLQKFKRLEVSSLDAEIHCLLSSPESIDDEEQNSLEKLQVIALH